MTNLAVVVEQTASLQVSTWNLKRLDATVSRNILRFYPCCFSSVCYSAESVFIFVSFSYKVLCYFFMGGGEVCRKASSWVTWNKGETFLEVVLQAVLSPPLTWWYLTVPLWSDSVSSMFILFLRGRCEKAHTLHLTGWACVWKCELPPHPYVWERLHGVLNSVPILSMQWVLKLVFTSSGRS